MSDEERALDEIYAAPQQNFVTTRDAWVKRLRDQGDKAAAARLKALKRPTAAAWILNQVARAHRAELDALVEAGQALAAAQRRGDREGLRRAGEEVRGRVRALLQRAREVLGKTPAPSLGRALGQALHHAAAGEAIDELRAGRLEREPSGATGFEVVAPVESEAPSKKKEVSKTKERERDAAQRAEKQREAAQKAEKQREREAAQRAEEQRKLDRERQRERDRLAHDLDRAQKRAARLRSEADQAAHAADEAERALGVLERKFREFT